MHWIKKKKKSKENTTHTCTYKQEGITWISSNKIAELNEKKKIIKNISLKDFRLKEEKRTKEKYFLNAFYTAVVAQINERPM